MMNREFLQLAQVYKDQDVKGWYCSEKLDGMRAFWDGGITKGMMSDDVPFANGGGRECTGLWSRYGKPIAAPDWWLEELPENKCLDGELYLGRQQFQQLISITKRYVSDADWTNVKYMVFDSPAYHEVFCDGKINNPNFKKEFSGIMSWIGRNSRSFRFEELVESGIEENEIVHFHAQFKLKSKNDMKDVLDVVLKSGGEGLMLRHPKSLYIPRRVPTLLKVKAKLDDEAVVTGYIWGKGKLEGLMGAMLVSWKDRSFELSGFTDEERVMTDNSNAVPGKIVSSDIENIRFPRGSIVTFTYSGLTERGIPREARFLRDAS